MASMADIIRRAFRESGLSIKRLSVLSGVPYSACHGLLTGNRDVHISTVEKLSKVLGLKLVRRDK